MTAPPRFRYARRRTGVLVAIAAAVFVASVLQAGFLQTLFQVEVELRVLLPETGLSGLNEGASVDVLGTEAGQVNRIVLRPDEPFYAEVGLAPEMQPFIRRDSEAVIRKQFGIAGSAYLEITRGTGDPLDWDFAVIEARTDRAPTDSIGNLIDDVRDQVFPVIADTRRAVAALADLSEALAQPDGELRGALADVKTVTEGVASGEGNLGRLVRDDELIGNVEDTVATLNSSLDRITPILENLERTSKDLATMGETLSSQGVPGILRQVNGILNGVGSILEEIEATMPTISTTMDNASGATESLPSLLVQTEATLSELRAVLRQLRQSWVLGGGGEPADDTPRVLSPIEGGEP